jgi:flagella basal body P-ring formation protein FlgA
MIETILRTGTIALAMAAAAAAQSGEDPFPAFRANVAGLVAAQVPGADGAQVQFSNPAVAAGAAQLYGPSALLSLQGFDARACRFAVKVENPMAQLPAALITGTCAPLARIPVAARDLRPGDAITAAAITDKEELLARLPAGTVRDKAELLGKTPRQALAAGRPFAAAALRVKPLVEKGQAVTLRFRIGALELTAQGQAQADAAQGEPVEVLNLRSKKTISAVVTGPGEVSVAAPPSNRIAAAN